MGGRRRDDEEVRQVRMTLPRKRKKGERKEPLNRYHTSTITCPVEKSSWSTLVISYLLSPLIPYLTQTIPLFSSLHSSFDYNKDTTFLLVTISQLQSTHRLHNWVLLLSRWFTLSRCSFYQIGDLLSFDPRIEFAHWFFHQRHWKASRNKDEVKEKESKRGREDERNGRGNEKGGEERKEMRKSLNK